MSDKLQKAWRSFKEQVGLGSSRSRSHSRPRDLTRASPRGRRSQSQPRTGARSERQRSTSDVQTIASDRISDPQTASINTDFDRQGRAPQRDDEIGGDSDARSTSGAVPKSRRRSLRKRSSESERPGPSCTSDAPPTKRPSESEPKSRPLPYPEDVKLPFAEREMTYAKKIGTALFEKKSVTPTRGIGNTRKQSSMLTNVTDTVRRKITQGGSDRKSSERYSSLVDATAANEQKFHDMGVRQPHLRSSGPRDLVGWRSASGSYVDSATGSPRDTRPSSLPRRSLESSAGHSRNSPLRRQSETPSGPFDRLRRKVSSAALEITANVSNVTKRIRGIGQYIYVFGGGGLVDERGSMERYDINGNAWELLPARLPHSGIGSSVTACKDDIWMIGGKGPGEDPIGDTYVLKDDDSAWEQRKGLSFIRLSLGVAVLASNIFACGGLRENLALNVVEVYDEDDEWAERQPMIHPRYDFGLASFRGNLLAVGGLNSGRFNVTVVEQYSPGEGAWTELTGSMVTTRNGFQLVSGNSVLYAVGSSTPERFDGANWEELPRQTQLEISIDKPAGAFYGRHLYVLGGEARRGAQRKVKSSAVCQFDVGEESWSAFAPMREARSGCKALVCNRLMFSENENLDAEPAL